MAERADKNDGSCREVLSGRFAGKWRVQFLIPDPVTGGRKRLSRIFATKTEAKRFLQELRHGAKIVSSRRSAELTLADWFVWLAENDWPETLADQTIGNRQGRFKKYVQKRLGHMPLSRIDPLAIRAFYKQLKDEGVGDSLLLTIKRDLVRVYNQAITPYQRVSPMFANPFCLNLKTPMVRSAVALTPDEVVQALKQPLSDTQRAMLAILLLGGLRLGELMALTRGQVRTEAGLLVVDRAVVRQANGKQTVALPKGGKSRNAVMSSWLSMILRDFCRDMAPDDYLFRALAANQPRTKKLTYATWRTIIRDANLPADMTPHDCRLTMINIIEKHMPRVSITTLKDHVGHAATGVTEANYTRPLSTAQEVLREELDRVFAAL